MLNFSQLNFGPDFGGVVTGLSGAQNYGRQEDAALAEQTGAMSELGNLPPLQEPNVLGDKRGLMNTLIAGAVAGVFDKSGVATRAILDGYQKGRLAKADQEIQNQRLERAQTETGLKTKIAIAGEKRQVARDRRIESRQDAERALGRADKRAAEAANDREKLDRDNQLNLDRAQNRFNQATTAGEKTSAGRQLQHYQKLVGIEPMTDEQIAADAAAIASGRLAEAQKAARAVVAEDLKYFGHVSEERAGDMEEQIAAIAKNYQIPRDQLPQVPTLETLAKQKQDYWQKDVDRRFKHLVENDRKKLAQSLSRIEIAQKALGLATQRLSVSKDLATIGAYNAATSRWKAELDAAKGQMSGLESGSMGKLNHAIALAQAELDAANQNEDDEKGVEIRAKLGVLLSDQEAMQAKVLQNMGIQLDPGDPLGSAGKLIGAATAPAAAAPRLPAGPAVGGASSKMLQTKDGKTFSVQDAYNAAKRAIAAGGDTKAIVARYESLPGNPKWPG